VIESVFGLFRLCLLLGLLASAATGGLASAADDARPTPAASDHFAEAARAFGRGDFRAALNEFEAARALGNDDAATHYNIAVCRYKLGDYSGAEAEFRMLARRFPAMRALADYNLGLSLMRLGRTTEARASFESARVDGDEKVAGLAAAALARLGAASPPSASGNASSWTRLLDLSFGYDDNVALIEETGLPSGQSGASSFAEAFGYFSRYVGRDSDWRLDLTGYLVDYADTPEFNQIAGRVAGIREWRRGRWRVGVGPHYGRTTLDGEGLEGLLGASIDARYSLGSRSSIRVRWLHEEVDDLSPQYDYLAGRHDQSRLTYEIGRVRLGYERDQNDRTGAGVSSDRDRYLIRLDLPLPLPWYGDIGYDYRSSLYSELAVPRREDRHQLAFSLRRGFGADWQLELRYLYADNDSNDPLYTYQRQRVAAGISKLF